MQNLQGKKLTVLNIYRTDMFSDNAFAHICDNCGRTIINNAEVSDESGNKYTIGLDCKKTLIDKPFIDAIMGAGQWDSKYKAKEYNRNVNEVTKFLKLCSYPNTEIRIDSNEIFIKDTEKITNWGTKGEIIYMQNVHFLYKMGLKDFIQKLYNSQKILLS